MNSLLLTLGVIWFSTIGQSNTEFPKFQPKTIDPYVGQICYAVTLADVNSDEQLDIVAVTERSVLWYENPSWKKRVIIEDQSARDNVCIAAADIDEDGKIDFALGAGWTREGTIAWLSRSSSLDEPWRVHEIGREPSLHRMRFADVLNIGKPQLVLSPLNRSQGRGVRLMAMKIPSNPKSDRWTRDILDGRLNRLHNHWHYDLNGDSQIDTLTASKEGIHVFSRNQDRWNKSRIHIGHQGDEPNNTGAGEIKVGHLETEIKYIATIEPMHGNQVVVYTESKSDTATKQPVWKRQVIENKLRRGHALWTADVDRDGADEIIVGHSDPGSGPIKGPGIYIYDSVAGTPTRWEKHVIDDGGIATEDAVACDLNGDGWIDIVAGGRATHNLKLYINRGLDSR